MLEKISGGFRPRAIGAVVLAVCFLWTSSALANGGFSLLSGIGYSNSSESPKLLIGAELSSYTRHGSIFTGIHESTLGFHVSDALSLDGSEHSLTTGIEGTFRRSQGPFHLLLQGDIFFRQSGDRWVRSSGLGGSGMTGRVRGDFRVDYIESARATFPWFQKDLNGVAPQNGDQPFYRAHIGVSAMLLPRFNLSWSQDVRWRRNVDSDAGRLVVTTGPEFVFDSGRLALQGGMVFAEDGIIKPTGMIRYQFKPVDSKYDLQVTAATDSLEGMGPLLYGWLGYEGDSMDYGVAMRLEETSSGTLNPTVYFSIHPKF